MVKLIRKHDRLIDRSTDRSTDRLIDQAIDADVSMVGNSNQQNKEYLERKPNELVGRLACVEWQTYLVSFPACMPVRLSANRALASQASDVARSLGGSGVLLS